MDNPLVGKKITWTWETSFLGATFEVDFISNSQKSSQGFGTATGYSAVHDYDLAEVAPNTYMISWLKDDGDAMTVVLNLDEMKAYGSLSTLDPKQVFITGTINEISE